MEYFLLWILFSIAIGVAGSNRNISFWGAFFLSLILSPLIGLIITFSSRRKSEIEMQNIQERQLEEITKISDNKNSINNIDKLLEAKSLLDSGLISKEEFQEIKDTIFLKKKKENIHTYKYKVGNMVVDKYGNSMRITKLNNDGTYQCATNMGMTDAGSFKEHDITLRNY